MAAFSTNHFARRICRVTILTRTCVNRAWPIPPRSAKRRWNEADACPSFASDRMPQHLEPIANEILQHAKAAGLTLATAESCSAGRLATAFAKGESASQY